jgi:beta-lactamase superfamily II metal-dependent hydrolase
MTKEKDNKFYDLGMFTETARSTVLTGDVELENEDEMKKLGLDRPESYKVFQYPHHGAADAFPYALERKILPKNTVTVFSAGTVNKYGSPDPGTAERQHCPKLVNERFAFDYSITVR